MAAEARRSSDPLNLSAKYLNMWEIISLCLLNDPLKLYCHPQLYEKYYRCHFCIHHLNLEEWKPQQKDLSVFLIMLFALVTHKATAIARYEFLTENKIRKGILQQRLVPYVPDYHERLNYKLKFLLSVKLWREQTDLRKK